MYAVLLDGQVGLNNSLIISISTAGKDLSSAAYRQYKYCKQMLSGTITADNLFAFICEIDLPDSHLDSELYEKTLWDKTNWAQANPYLLYDDDYHVTKDINKWKDFEDIANKARMEEGSVLNNFIIKKLNCWSTVGSSSYLKLEDIAGIAGDAEDIDGKYCYIGLDLSSKNDLASFSAVFPAQTGLNLPYIYSHSFLPKNTLQRHILRDKVPYDRFAQSGTLSLTDCDGQNGYILDYKFIANFMKKFISDNNLKVKMIGYDSHQIGGIMSDLDDIDAEKVEIIQNPKSLNEATRHFQNTVRGRQVTYDRKNELLAMSFGNAIAVLNSKHELLIDKQDQRHRIDPVDAVLDAWKCYILTENTVTDDEKNEKQIDTWLSLMQEL